MPKLLSSAATSSRSCGPPLSCQRTLEVEHAPAAARALREEAVGRTAEVDAHRRRDGDAGRVDGQRLGVAGAADRPRLVAGGHRCAATATSRRRRSRSRRWARGCSRCCRRRPGRPWSSASSGTRPARRRARRRRATALSTAVSPASQPSGSKYIWQVKDLLVRSTRARAGVAWWSAAGPCPGEPRWRQETLRRPDNRPIAGRRRSWTVVRRRISAVRRRITPFGARYAAWRPPRAARRRASKSWSMSALFSITAYAPAALAWPSRPESAVAV